MTPEEFKWRLDALLHEHIDCSCAWEECELNDHRECVHGCSLLWFALNDLFYEYYLP